MRASASANDTNRKSSDPGRYGPGSAVRFIPSFLPGGAPCAPPFFSTKIPAARAPGRGWLRAGSQPLKDVGNLPAGEAARREVVFAAVDGGADRCPRRLYALPPGNPEGQVLKHSLTWFHTVSFRPLVYALPGGGAVYRQVAKSPREVVSLPGARFFCRYRDLGWVALLASRQVSRSGSYRLAAGTLAPGGYPLPVSPPRRGVRTRLPAPLPAPAADTHVLRRGRAHAVRHPWTMGARHGTSSPWRPPRTAHLSHRLGLLAMPGPSGLMPLVQSTTVPTGRFSLARPGTTGYRFCGCRPSQRSADAVDLLPAQLPRTWFTGYSRLVRFGPLCWPLPTAERGYLRSGRHSPEFRGPCRLPGTWRVLGVRARYVPGWYTRPYRYLSGTDCIQACCGRVRPDAVMWYASLWPGCMAYASLWPGCLFNCASMLTREKRVVKWKQKIFLFSLQKRIFLFFHVSYVEANSFLRRLFSLLTRERVSAVSYHSRASSRR